MKIKKTTIAKLNSTQQSESGVTFGPITATPPTPKPKTKTK